MGQAWTIALSWMEPRPGLYDKDRMVRRTETFFAHDYIYEWTEQDGVKRKIINGYKLMETAWVGNQMVNDVVKELIKHRNDSPSVVWVGEYVDRADADDKGLDELVKVVNSSLEINLRHDPDQEAYPDRVFIIDTESRDYILYDENESPDGTIAALALLTAIGNGNGGGDYDGINMDLVGKWANHELQISDVRPDSGNNLTYAFVEGRE